MWGAGHKNCSEILKNYKYWMKDPKEFNCPRS